MKLHLTEAQLLHEWQLRAFPEPVNAGCDMARVDGVDLEAVLRAAMLDWYRRLLRDAPEPMLAPVKLTLPVTVDTDGTGHVELPDTVVRVLSLCDGRCKMAVITDMSSRLARLQQSPYTRGTPDAPVALMAVDGHVDIYTVAPGCREVTVEAVIDDGVTYSLDAAALATVGPLQYTT